jgi:Calx-beta domain-containing protein
VIVRAQLAFAAATLFLVLAAASAAADVPSLVVSDALVTEGDSGTKNALFTVSLSAASAGPVTVDYATADGSAKAPGDYTATTGTLIFAAGELSKQVAVGVVGDTLDELHETYSLNLSNPVGATLGNARGAGTILDNDPQASLSVDDVPAPEGGQSATFTLSLSRESGKMVAVDYATGDGTAAAPSDYASRSGTIIFMAGETSKTVSVALVEDAVIEPDETFTLALSRAINATLSDGQGVATIVDDDAAPPPPPPPPGDEEPPPPPPGDDPPPPPPPGDEQPPPGDEEPPVSEPPANEPPADPPNAAPDCSGVQPSPNRLWAPNHKFRLVSLAGATDPDGDALSYEIRSVTQDEPVLRGLDAKRGERSDQVWLRAERRGKGDGRVYRIEYLAWDSQGNACDGTAKVVVPHDRAHPAALDSGASFDSFEF